MNLFRKIALFEGISYLLLFCVTWPLKGLGIVAWPNKVVGMAHGLLFIAYCILAIVLAKKEQWPTKQTFIILLASLIPFGTFYIDKKYLR